MSSSTPTSRQTRLPARSFSGSSPASPTTAHISARGAVPPRVVGSPARPAPASSRRGSIRATPPPGSSSPKKETPNGTADQGSVSALLKRETEEKENLLIKLQDLEASIASLTNENTQYVSTLKAAESRLTEFYADQARLEDEMIARQEVADKLRTQIRELEKEKRDSARRYEDQTRSFDAERQAFYDNEQHLKSRIMSLAAARKQQLRREPSMAQLSEVGEEIEDEPEEEPAQPTEEEEEAQEPPEIVALKLELSTLATSYASLQSSLQLQQTQMHELQRVNKELQEENESYNILLLERTLTGQYAGDLIRQTAASPPASMSLADETSSLYGTSGARSIHTLDVVSEVNESPYPAHPPNSLELELANAGLRSPSPDSSSFHTGESRRKGKKDMERGETLADLPVAGPGLDLAAELGRAEMFEGGTGGIVEPPTQPKSAEMQDPHLVESLRGEIKTLKDANKALNLYASKILDRIISHGGFENVLAVDYGEEEKPAPAPIKKERPRSMSFWRSVTSSTDPSAPPAVPPTPQPDQVSSPDPQSPPPSEATAKRSKRGISMDWSRLSIWGSSTPAAPALNPNLRPLTLTPGTVSKSPRTPSFPSSQTARKLDTTEDEEDKRLRERLAAEMRLHGIEKPEVISSSPTPPITSPTSTGLKARIPFFGRARSDTSTGSGKGDVTPPQSLTSEALEQAEAEQSLAALDAREKMMVEELSKGGRPGGLTELPRIGGGSGGSLSERARQRRRASGAESTSGSALDKDDARSVASTLWSAGRASPSIDEEHV